MNDLPIPLVPPEVDLSDFHYMPLDVQRLRDSDLASECSPEACWAAVLLWCASWHQVPAGSIPDSELWQAKQAGYAARGKVDKGWTDVKKDALRNWVKCADGRLYHPVVAEKALTAWKEKFAQRARTKAATEAREAKRRAANEARDDDRNVQRDEQRDVERNEQRNEARDVHQGKGKGKGREEKNSVPDGTGVPPLDDPVRRLWLDGVALLTAAGVDERGARSLLGKLRKQHGDVAVLEAVTKAQTETVIDPVPWLIRTVPVMAAAPGVNGHNVPGPLPERGYSAAQVAAAVGE